MPADVITLPTTWEPVSSETICTPATVPLIVLPAITASVLQFSVSPIPVLVMSLSWMRLFVVLSSTSPVPPIRLDVTSRPLVIVAESPPARSTREMVTLLAPSSFSRPSIRESSSPAPSTKIPEWAAVRVAAG